MDSKTKIEELKTTIESTLSPIIGEKAILIDLPYHGNVGDILIWEGELSFFKTIKINLISQTSCYTFQFSDLSTDITICIHGGGNFGDLYPESHDFKKKVIEKYPNNKIVIFPQSVWYENKDLIKADSDIFSKHKDLHICARDKFSYDFLVNNFSSNNIYLVPDMAFYIHNIVKGAVQEPKDNRVLYIKRLDKELKEPANIINSPYDERDWPYFEGKGNIHRLIFGLARRINKIKIKRIRSLLALLIDVLMNNIIRDQLIKQGVILLKPYKKILTTRLHAMILGILLDKDVVAFNNTTKKISAYYNTWLTDLDNVVIK